MGLLHRSGTIIRTVKAGVRPAFAFLTEGNIMADHICIRRAPGTWVVRTNEAVLGESSAALELTEGDYPPVIYFPRDDIAMALLDQTDKSTHCPQKGDATYFTIVTQAGQLDNAAWGYDSPKEGAAELAGHLAFHSSDEVRVEQL